MVLKQQQNEKLPKEIGILIMDLYLSVHYVHLHKSRQKLQNYDFQSQFSMSKIIQIIPIFFSSNNINLGAHILLLTFFDNFNS